MKKECMLPCMICLSILCLSAIPVNAEDGGGITLDFTQFKDQMETVNQSERPSYGAESTATLKSNEFTSMSIGVVKVEDGIETTCWEANITTLENISIALDPGTYKVYTQLEGDNTVLEYNNDSEGYVITPQSHLVIPMAYPPWEGYILDAPWRIENSEINIPILAVDTGTDWADIYDINVYDHNDGDRFVASTNWSSIQPIYLGDTFFYLFKINKSSFVQVDGKVSIRIKFELHWSFDNWEGPVNVKISQYDIPAMVDWYCGDTHQHTNYTDNAVETGAPIYATRAANNAMGLDWMIVTDHSFDLNLDKWNVSTADCNAHSDYLFRVMQGEEVSCYLPTYLQYYHLLVYGADFIPGGEWEDGSGGDYTLAEVIAIANNQGGITYAAHPMYNDGIRPPWRNEDYNLPFTGLQVWNYGTWKDNPNNLPNGLAKWRELLLGGRHVYVEGGTDAHGDFNTLAGKAKTYVYASGRSQSSLPPRSEILEALRNGHSIMTDGPLVIFDINGVGIGNSLNLTNWTDATLHIQWNSTPEFGYLNNITVKKGVINETDETTYNSTSPETIGKDNLSDDYNLTIAPNRSCYYRIEAISITTSGEEYRCYTNLIWVDIVNDTTAPEINISFPVNGTIIDISEQSRIVLTGNATDDVSIEIVCYTHDRGGFLVGGCIPVTSNKTILLNLTIDLVEGINTISVFVSDTAGNSVNETVIVTGAFGYFDMGTLSNPYQSISGTHNGTITPNHTIVVSTLYTYPCAGTGGHTEYVKIWKGTETIAEGNWTGYQGDWHNLSFDSSIMLEAYEMYNYTIKTGSYPQIIHEPTWNATGGTITCTIFTDANGRTYTNWIPAIRLS